MKKLTLALALLIFSSPAFADPFTKAGGLVKTLKGDFCKKLARDMGGGILLIYAEKNYKDKVEFTAHLANQLFIYKNYCEKY